MGHLSALQLAQCGVRFEHSGARVTVHGPRSMPELAEIIRAEVARRMPRLAGSDLPRDPAARLGKCETCGDEMAHYRGGMCSLCCFARGKALGVYA
jgi:hypothetical protein